MKTKLPLLSLVLVALLFSAGSRAMVPSGTNVPGQASVLQKIFALPEVVKYWPVKADGSQGTLLVQQYPVEFSREVTDQLKSLPVRFCSVETTRAHQNEPCLVFRAMKMEGATLRVTLNLFHDRQNGKAAMALINVELQQQGNDWIITHVTDGGKAK